MYISLLHTSLSSQIRMVVLLVMSTILPGGFANSDSDSQVYSDESTSALSPTQIAAFLQSHNTVRAQHGASPLSWNGILADKAEQWASYCQFRLSGGTLGPYGGSNLNLLSRFVYFCISPGNLATGTGPTYDISAAVKSWTDEVCKS